jgi:hypothetical protein
MEHTPGPWKVDEVWSLIMGPNGEEVAAVHSGVSHPTRANRNTAHANARLIAAAPDMLAALQEALKSLEYAAMVLEAPEKSAFRENIVDARAAIEKAVTL